jgi:hypothetical protein
VNGVGEINRGRALTGAPHRRLRSWVAARAIAFSIMVVALVMLLAPIASANYYSVAFGDNPNGAWGGYAELCVNWLWVYDWQHEHANNTLWVGFDTNGDFAHWTEAGIGDGLYVYNDVSTPTFYWADDSSAYGYNEHWATDGPTFGDSYQAQVAHYSPPWWYVQIAEHYSYSSYHNTSYTYGLETGLEFQNTNTNYEQETGS